MPVAGGYRFFETAMISLGPPGQKAEECDYTIFKDAVRPFSRENW
jgi:hypothetical protein